MSGIRSNFFYSSILTTANYIFPLLTYPYVSRVLGVSNIGLVNFVDGIINYLVLFSMLGISVTGIREIASVKESREDLNRTFSSFFFISLFLTIIAIIVLIILTCIVPQMRLHVQMMCIGGIKLVFNLFLIEWFYKGLENFKYITFRGLMVRCVYVISVFIFVKTSNDYNIYYLLTCLTIVFNAIINTIYSKKFVSLSIRNLTLKKYLKPIIIIGVYNILTSMYTTFNIVLLRPQNFMR